MKKSNLDVDITEEQAKQVWNWLAQKHGVPFKVDLCFSSKRNTYRMLAYNGTTSPNPWYCLIEDSHFKARSVEVRMKPNDLRNNELRKALLDKALNIAKDNDVIRVFAKDLTYTEHIVFLKGITLAELLIQMDLES